MSQSPKDFRIVRPRQIPVPWSPTYESYHDQFISFALSNPAVRECFRETRPLPGDYGIAIDERCIEIPWYFEMAGREAKFILDAGSALNYQFAVRHPYLRDRKLTILTLAPEENCFWQLGISYQFGDLRRLPFRDHFFDEIVCISTIEHVGMDNSLFTGTVQCEHFDENDLALALKELNRVLRPEGRLLVTVPFGKYENWGEFQQFDAALLDQAAGLFGAKKRTESFFQYTGEGWRRADNRDECRDMTYSRYALSSQWGNKKTGQLPEPDMVAAARAVACCIWEK